MRLGEYSDDEIIEEIKHRGIKIEVPIAYRRLFSTNEITSAVISKVIIGGVTFDIAHK
jgi:hypothetical protein